MKSNNNVGLIVSFIVLIGFPLLFLIISWRTGNWSHLAFSIPGTLAAGLTGLMVTLHHIKKEKT